MSKKLLAEAIMKVLAGMILVGVLIFVPAGTINYVNGWVFVCLLFVPMIVAGIVMFVKKPELLRKRLDAKEKQKEQGIVVKISGLMFVFGFVVAGLDFRCGWSHFPMWITVVACVLFVIAYLVYAEVIRENAYLSRTIRVEHNQKVVDAGLYRIVRHPMYCATLFLFMTMPIILDSVYSLLVFLVYPFVIAKRIKFEEILLETELEGYREYKKKVKYKMIPFVW